VKTCPSPFVLEDGRCRYSVPYRIFDEAGHPLDGDHDPKGKHGAVTTR
jgi:hypothetical protein